MKSGSLVRQKRVFGELYAVLYIKIDKECKKMEMRHHFTNGVTLALTVCLEG